MNSAALRRLLEMAAKELISVYFTMYRMYK